MISIAAKWNDLAGAWAGRYKLASGPVLVSGALIAGIILQLSALILGEVHGHGVLDGAAVALPAQSIATVPAETVAAIGRLFGTAEAEGAAPDSESSLVLSGTIATQDPGQGMAFLGADGSPQIYRVGAELPGGLRLTAIYTDRVVVDRNGTTEVIRFPRTLSAGAGTSPLVAMQTEDPAAGMLGGFVRSRAVKLGSRLTGYSVYPADDPAGFADLGLRAGDLIVAINGTRLDNPNGPPDVMATLTWAPSVTVTVKRGGREKDLAVDVARASANAAERRELTELSAEVKDPVFIPHRGAGARGSNPG